jgi:toxin FitB
MTNYLLDTNIVSELIAVRPNFQLLTWIDELEPRNIYLSVVTFGEIQKGVEKLPHMPRRQQLQIWLDYSLPVKFANRIFLLDVPTMLAWGTLTATLAKTGRVLPVMDSLIAVQALRHSCVLVTRNEKDFVGTGVVVLNP